LIAGPPIEVIGVDMLPADTVLSFILPEKLRLAIADAIVIQSRIENCVVEIIWMLKGVPQEQRQNIAKESAADSFKRLRKALPGEPLPLADKFWETLTELRRQRNLIAHGSWAIMSDGRPLVVWHSLDAGGNDYVTSTIVDDEYFDWFMRQANQAFIAFSKIRNALEDSYMAV
jgi:hypothetical protein